MTALIRSCCSRLLDTLNSHCTLHLSHPHITNEFIKQDLPLSDITAARGDLALTLTMNGLQ